jgi:AcrR family transcriptional regulator
MGRRKTIDRDRVLEVAEDIVSARGAAALTIDAVAKAAGITKGGVQSCFGTKEALVAAMLDRLMAAQEQRFAKIAGDTPSRLARIAAHVRSTQQDDDGSHSRAAGLLTILLQSPGHLDQTIAWYRDRSGGLTVTGGSERKGRLAFLASEGAFFLRFFGLMPMSREIWNEIFDDISCLYQTELTVEAESGINRPDSGDDAGNGQSD